VSWTAVRILPGQSTRESRDAIVAALFAQGAQAVVEDGAALVTHFPEGSDLDRVDAAVRAADPGASVTHARVADADWRVAWRDQVTAHRVGALTVAPPWLARSLDPAHTIVIDPGMAFGTGDHASTRGVLRLLPGALRGGAAVADVGSGSAVLAIAAAKLGARRAYAIESDPDAITNAVANVCANGVEDRVHVLEGDALAMLPLVAPVQLVLANIISSVLIELLPVIEVSLAEGGRAILSGLLVSERAAWQSLLAGRHWRILEECHEGDWWTVAIAKS